MVDIVLISTLIASLFTGMSQIVQTYLDYKRETHAGNNEKVYNIKSECCNFELENENDDKK